MTWDFAELERARAGQVGGASRNELLERVALSHSVCRSLSSISLCQQKVARGQGSVLLLLLHS